MVWRLEDAQAFESEKVRWEAVPYLRGLGLDIGCGPCKVLPHVIGIDNRADSAMFNIAMNPDMTVPDASELPLYSDKSMDFCYSSHLLEHIVDYKKALKEWWRLVKVGGYMILYLPHKNFYPNISCKGMKIIPDVKKWSEDNKSRFKDSNLVAMEIARLRLEAGVINVGEQYAGTLCANQDHKHDFLPKDIISAMKEIGESWSLLANQERNEKNEYSFFQVFKKTDDGKQKQPWTSPKPKKTAGICRYGAIGDIIQTGSIAAALKAEGYHVTLMCETRGYQVGMHDPNYDHFIVQDKDQVPNQELGQFWDYWKGKFDKWVNLSESVEGSLLALPDRIQGGWPLSMRQKHLNHNYLEWMHDIAETNYGWFKEGQRFFPTEQEKDWAKAQRAKMGGLCILWPLAGSSVHKRWAGGIWGVTHDGKEGEITGFDTIVGRILAATDSTLVMVGDKTCQLLEEPWNGNERVWKRSGQWTIRETLSFAQVADIVIGPETGVVNSVAFLNMAKIVFLSHSTVNNLTRDWKNTESLIPQNTHCYPCHMMHFTADTCQLQKHGEALCQMNIHFDKVWNALCKQIPIEHFLMPDKRLVGE